MGKRRIFLTARIFVGTFAACSAHAGNVGLDKSGQSQFSSVAVTSPTPTNWPYAQYDPAGRLGCSP
jgi:hypothetical protein